MFNKSLSVMQLTEKVLSNININQIYFVENYTVQDNIIQFTIQPFHCYITGRCKMTLVLKSSLNQENIAANVSLPWLKDTEMMFLSY